MAEIRVQRRSDRVAPGNDTGPQGLQIRAAFAEGGRTIPQKGGALASKDVAQPVAGAGLRLRHS